jgi:chromatin segregation and condensation protein Rec8/ScpA/Scc1 (kleisin family)
MPIKRNQQKKRQQKNREGEPQRNPSARAAVLNAQHRDQTNNRQQQQERKQKNLLNYFSTLHKRSSRTIRLTRRHGDTEKKEEMEPHIGGFLLFLLRASVSPCLKRLRYLERATITANAIASATAVSSTVT